MTKENIIKNPSLETLLRFAAENANAKFAEHGKIPTTFWCVGDQDLKAVGAWNLGNNEQKETFEKLCRLLCVAEAAKATVFIAEIWTVLSATKDGVRPSQHPQRQECVAIKVELPGLRVTSLYSIIRNKVGKPKLGSLVYPPNVEHICQFDQLLPIGIPSPAERILAAMSLAPLTHVSWN